MEKDGQQDSLPSPSGSLWYRLLEVNFSMLQ